MSRITVCRLTLVILSLVIVSYLGWFSMVNYPATLLDSLRFQAKQSEPKLWNPLFTENQPVVSMHYEELKKLGDVVQRRLHYLQHPRSCDQVRTVKCRIHNCGFGCQINTVAMCLLVGYATNRTVVLTSQLTSLLKPFSSTCMGKLNVKTSKKWGPDHEKFQEVVFGVLVRQLYKPEFFPPAIPTDLASSIERYHSDPFLWWVGQVTCYVNRPRNQTLQFLQNEETKLGFSSPIVGIQVRRTDKLKGEAKFHRLEEYMVHVDKWYDQLEQTKSSRQRKIFLATDDPTVKQEINTKYPGYTIINNEIFTKKASVTSARKSHEGYRGIIHDVHMLSKCDFIVCTFSSNVCRLAYQLMQVNRGNASAHAKSVDIPWYFYGQRPINKTTTKYPLLANMPTYDGIGN